MQQRLTRPCLAATTTHFARARDEVTNKRWSSTNNMAKGVAKTNTQQRSIASFFASPPPKRKTPDADASKRDGESKAQTTMRDDTRGDGDDNDDAKPAAAKKSRVASPVKPTSSKPPTSSTIVVAVNGNDQNDASEEPERVAEPDDDGDVEMDAPTTTATTIDDKDNDEGDAMRPTPTKAKPGRRRLRQRVEVSDDDDDDDVDFALASKKSLLATSKDAPIAVDAPDASDNDDDANAAVASPAKHLGRTKAQTQASEAPKTTAVDKTPASDASKTVAAAAVTVVETKPMTPVKATPTKKANKAATKTEAKSEVVKTETKLVVSTKKKAAASGFFAARTESLSKASVKSEAADATGDATATTDAEQSSSIAYASLAHLFNTIEATSSRLAIQELLLQFFRDVIRRAPQDLLACIYLCVCTDLAPPFENLKIGIGDAILMKAIGEATGTNMKFIKEMYQKEGDLGKVAQNARSKQHTLSFASSAPASAKRAALGVQDVYQQFVKIAKMTGNNSQQQKCSIIKALLVKCEKDRKSAGAGADSAQSAAEGAKYIIRGLQGKLRIGLAEKSILIGLTYAFMREKDASDKDKQLAALASVKKAFAECPSYNALVAAFEDVQRESPTAPLLRGEDFAKVADRCVLTPGTPVSPMLARPTKAYTMVFDRFQGMPFTCEYKYDGERAQIHILASGDIAIFSRNFENSTERFPDVTLAIAKAAKKHAITSCIVDAEVVAVDKATNKRLPFQILSTRSRKNVKVEDIKVPVCIYVFDLLFLDGESYLTKPLAERRRKLQDVFELEAGVFELATSIDVEPPEGIKDDAEAMEVAVDTVRTFLEEAVRENCEGLMVKTLQREATYEPANRSHKWLKLKKDYLDGIGDSTDLVPIGAFHGRGKRTGVYGAYLLACYDPDTEMYQPITKLGTGLSDEVLKQFYEQLKEKVVDKAPQDYATGDGIKPDVWFEPTCVWEILGADLSISPKYTAGMGLVAKDKGISLRFPRFIRIRDDKNTTDATTSTQIADLYRAQGLATVSGAGEDDDDDMLI